MRETIITTIVTVTISLIITFLFNGLVNRPKKKRQEEEKREADREKFKADLLCSMSQENQKIYEELKKHSAADAEIRADLQLCKLGLQAVIKNTLKNRYEKWIREGQAPLDAKDDLERMYQVYHQLGANGVMDSLREKFLALPDAIPNKKPD